MPDRSVTGSSTPVSPIDALASQPQGREESDRIARLRTWLTEENRLRSDVLVETAVRFHGADAVTAAARSVPNTLTRLVKPWHWPDDNPMPKPMHLFTRRTR